MPRKKPQKFATFDQIEQGGVKPFGTVEIESLDGMVVRHCHLSVTQAREAKRTFLEVVDEKSELDELAKRIEEMKESDEDATLDMEELDRRRKALLDKDFNISLGLAQRFIADPDGTPHYDPPDEHGNHDPRLINAGSEVIDEIVAAVMMKILAPGRMIQKKVSEMTPSDKPSTESPES